jgi:beta-glucuronidase
MMSERGYEELPSTLGGRTDTRAVAAKLLCGGRKPIIDLNGPWQASPDREGRGRSFLRKLEAGQTGAPDLPGGGDFEDWERQHLPSSWNCQDEGFAQYEGGFWFYRALGPVARQDEERLVLHFGAANYETLVFVNGGLVASHRGGFTPFSADVTAELRADSPNSLLVWVDSALPTTLPLPAAEPCFNYGGIHRDIGIYRLPEVHVTDWSLGVDKKGQIVISLALNLPLRLPLDLKIGKLLDKTFLTRPDGGLEAKLDIAPDRWSPETPRLYEVDILCGHDAIHERIGFRQIEVQGRELLLNGRKLFLRGISIHEESAEHGCSMTREERLAALRLAAELNCNFVRLAHCPHSGEMAALADELGILLWEELPIRLARDEGAACSLEQAKAELLELLKRDRNRASVAIWALDNEVPEDPAATDLLIALVEAARAADPSRPIAASCLVDAKKLLVSKKLAAAVDVVALDDLPGWNRNEPGFLDKALEGEVDKPLVLRDIGLHGLLETEEGSGLRWTEDYQAEVFGRQLDALLSTRKLAGASPWALYDFCRPRPGSLDPEIQAKKGLVESDRATKKKAFHLVGERYAERRDGHH